MAVFPVRIVLDGLGKLVSLPKILEQSTSKAKALNKESKNASTEMDRLLNRLTQGSDDFDSSLFDVISSTNRFSIVQKGINVNRYFTLAQGIKTADGATKALTVSTTLLNFALKALPFAAIAAVATGAFLLIRKAISFNLGNAQLIFGRLFGRVQLMLGRLTTSFFFAVQRLRPVFEPIFMKMANAIESVITVWFELTNSFLNSIGTSKGAFSGLAGILEQSIRLITHVFNGVSFIGRAIVNLSRSLELLQGLKDFFTILLTTIRLTLEFVNELIEGIGELAEKVGPVIEKFGRLTPGFKSTEAMKPLGSTSSGGTVSTINNNQQVNVTATGNLTQDDAPRIGNFLAYMFAAGVNQ